MAALNATPFAGPLSETLIASEIAKAQINRGKRRELYYFRDQQSLEADFVIPGGGDRLFMLEAKSSRTLKPAMADSLLRLGKNAEKYRTGLYLVHPDPAEKDFRIVKEGVSIASVSELPGILFGR